MGFHRQGRGIEIRKIPNGEVVATLPTGTGTTDYFRHFDFSPDGKFFVATFEEKGTEESGGRDRLTARLFDTSTWEQTAVLSTDEVAQYCSNFHYAAFSPDSKLVVTTAETGSHSMVTIWNALDGNKIRNITTACCRVVLFFPDGGTMATGGSASPRHSPVHNINFWDVKTGRLRARVAASPTYTIALSPDRRFLVTGDLDEHAWIWDLTNYRKVPYVDECIDGSTQASNGRSSSKSPTGFPVASTDNLPAQQGQPPRVIPAKQTEPPSEPQMFDLPMPERPLASRVHDGGVTGMAVSPDGKLLVTAGHYGDIKIWSFPEGKLLKRIEKANESGVSLAIRPDGKHFVTVTDHNYPKIFSLPDGKRVKTLHWELGLGPFSSVNAGVGIVALSTREGIEVRSLMEGSLIRTLAVEGRMTYGRWLDISRDGRLLAAAHADDVLRLWSLKDGKLIHGDLRFPQFHPGPLSLSPSCDRVAVIDGNIIPSGVKIWSLPDGHLRKIFKISVSGVSTVTFASDDVLLFAELGAIRILSLNENKIVGSIVDQSNVGGMF